VPATTRNVCLSLILANRRCGVGPRIGAYRISASGSRPAPEAKLPSGNAVARYLDATPPRPQQRLWLDHFGGATTEPSPQAQRSPLLIGTTNVSVIITGIVRP
jgi:hypothetical protein